MTTEKANFQGYANDHPSVEEVYRASPEPGSYYRCPVSTPLHTGTRPPRQKFPESLTFVSLDFQKVENLTKPKHHRGMPAGKKIMPRRKNMDYYYIDKEFQKRIAAQSNSLWLRSLCAQPVDEIFSKYRLLSEVKKQQETLTRGYTTPGEKAIFEAWETNSSRRLGSAGSRSSLTSRATTVSASPQLSVVSKSYRKVHTGVDSAPRHNSLVDSSTQQSPGESGLQTPVVSRATPTGLMRSKTEKLQTNINPVVEDTFYDQFKRQTPKLPDLTKKSYSFNPRQRKIIQHGNDIYILSQPSTATASPSVSPRKLELSSSGNTNFSLFEINENGGS